MRRRGASRARRSRRSATTSPSTARRASTASRSCRNARSRTSAAACRATRATSRRATSRRWSRRPSASCGSPRSICPTAIRSAREKFAYKLAWMDRLSATPASAARLRGAAGRWPATTTSSPSRGDATRPGGLGQRRAVPAARRAGQVPRALQPRPDRRGPRLRRRGRASTPSGTTRPAPGRGTTASASTICCCRRRPPTGWPASRSTRHMRGWEKPSDHVPVDDRVLRSEAGKPDRQRFRSEQELLEVGESHLPVVIIRSFERASS